MITIVVIISFMINMLQLRVTDDDINDNEDYVDHNITKRRMMFEKLSSINRLSKCLTIRVTHTQQTFRYTDRRTPKVTHTHAHKHACV